MASRLLVTGGAGFIGANFVHYWLERHPGDRVVVLDALTYAGNRASLAAADESRDFRFVQGDIRDQALVERLLREEALDTLVHFAAESHVDRSILGPDAFVETNILGTHALLKAARAVWLAPGNPRPHRFHHISTDEVFGSLGPDDPPFSESTAYAPNSPYSASKAASDHLVRAWHHTYGLATTTSNCSNNYGPFQFPEKLVALTIVNILHGRSLPIYGDGQNIRDWLYVRDHCAAIDRILEAGQVGETYAIGGEAPCTNLDLVGALCRAVDAVFAREPALAQRFPEAPPAQGRASDSLIGFVADRPGHDRRYDIDATRMADELHFRPEVSLSEGIASTVDWYLRHENWWQAILDGDYRQWVARQYGAP